MGTGSPAVGLAPCVTDPTCRCDDLGAKLLPNLVRHGHHVGGRNGAPFREIARQHHTVANKIDPSRDASGDGVDRLERLRLETGVARPGDMLQAMLHVGLRFGPVKGSEMIGGNDTLSKLLQLAAVQDLSQLGLADQEALEKRAALELEVRQHSQLLDGPRAEVLRLVDHQERPPALRHQSDQKCFDVAEQLGFAGGAGGNTEGGRDGLQQIFGVELGRDDLGGDHLLRIEPLEQAADQRGLAGTDLSGYDDETLALIQAVLEIRVRARVPAAREEELGVRIQLEGLSRQPVERLVHARGLERMKGADEDRDRVVVGRNIGVEVRIVRTREQRRLRADARSPGKLQEVRRGLPRKRFASDRVETGRRRRDIRQCR